MCFGLAEKRSLICNFFFYSRIVFILIVLLLLTFDSLNTSEPNWATWSELCGYVPQIWAHPCNADPFISDFQHDETLVERFSVWNLMYFWTDVFVSDVCIKFCFFFRCEKYNSRNWFYTQQKCSLECGHEWNAHDSVVCMLRLSIMRVWLCVCVVHLCVCMRAAM